MDGGEVVEDVEEADVVEAEGGVEFSIPSHCTVLPSLATRHVAAVAAVAAVAMRANLLFPSQLPNLRCEWWNGVVGGMMISDRKGSKGRTVANVARGGVLWVKARRRRCIFCEMRDGECQEWCVKLKKVGLRIEGINWGGGNTSNVSCLVVGLVVTVLHGYFNKTRRPRRQVS